MKVEVGQLWRVNPSREAWKIEEIIAGPNKERVKLSFGDAFKFIQVQHLQSSYMLVGSDKEKQHIEE